MNFWVSWRAPAGRAFEMATPCYELDDYHGGKNMVAAVRADDVAGAKQAVYGAYLEHPGSLRFLSIQSKADGWSPWDPPPRPAKHEGPWPPKDWRPQFPREPHMEW